MARLRIISGDGVEQVLELRDQRLQIGRGRDSDIVLPDPEKGVSRTHAELRLENDRYVLVDLQSQNGTWLNGARVERAEVPFGAEIAVGGYRLTLLRDGDAAGPPAAHVRRADPLDDMRPTGPHAPPPYSPPAASRTSPPSSRAAAPAPSNAGGPAPWAMGLAVAVVVMVALAATVWVMGTRTPPQEEGSSAGSPGAPSAPPDPVVPPPAARPIEPAALATPDRQPNPSYDVAEGGSKPQPVKTQGAVSGTPRVGRRPGESSEAWRSRGAALQMRYEYSTAALTRGDFAAAAGGFEAILIEEPGFLDAAGLLVQAQSGLRSSARRLFDSGQKLEAAGDWVGALQKYEQARQVFAGIDGLSGKLQQVRQKLHAAGTSAFNEGRQHEADGRTEDAVKAYEKAIQWLPSDDPNRQVARTRVEQLKRTIEGYPRGQQ